MITALIFAPPYGYFFCIKAKEGIKKAISNIQSVMSGEGVNKEHRIMNILQIIKIFKKMFCSLKHITYICNMIGFE